MKIETLSYGKVFNLGFWLEDEMLRPNAAFAEDWHGSLHGS